MPSIFLSHNHADKDFVRKIAADLKILGVDVWIDEAEIKVGDSLIEKIRSGIDNVDYVAVILSPESINSHWVKREVDIAMNQEIAGKIVRVLPLLIKDCPIPSFLPGRYYADFRISNNYQVELDKLCISIGIKKNDYWEKLINTQNTKKTFFKISNTETKKALELQPFLNSLGYNIDLQNSDIETTNSIRKFQKDNGLYDDGIFKHLTLNKALELRKKATYIPLPLFEKFNSTSKTPFERDQRQGFLEWFEKKIYNFKNIPFYTTDSLVSISNRIDIFDVKLNTKNIYIFYNAGWIYDRNGVPIDISYTYEDGEKINTMYHVYDWTRHKNKNFTIHEFKAICDEQETLGALYIQDIPIQNSKKLLNSIEISCDNNMIFNIIAITIKQDNFI